MTAPLSVKHIIKKYAKFTVLDDVSFTLKKGDITSIVGESGCGKTTLLRIIAGHEASYAGMVEIHGTDHSHSPARERNVGLVFQEYALFPHLTAEKNISFGLPKSSPSAKASRVAELLNLVGLPAYGKRYPHELSGGQQQRIAIARALAPSPSLLLMDEPFSNLDPIKRRNIRESIQTITQKSQTSCLIVTHDIQDAVNISDHIIILREGKIIQQGTPTDILAMPNCAYVRELIG